LVTTTPRGASPTTAPRADQVRATRQRVLGAARDLFLRRGYTGATIEAIAHRAQVSPQTVYNVVGSKAALLKAVYDVALAGDDEPVPMAERPIVRAMEAAEDARSCLSLYARMAREIIAGVGPIVAVIFAQGSSRDPDLRAFVDKIEGERAVGTAGVADHIATTFGLRPGLSVTEAGDILWALTSPELLDRFTRRRGWTLDRYEAWLADAMADALVGPRPPSGPTPRSQPRPVAPGCGRRPRRQKRKITPVARVISQVFP
jgi:AcrR family transcriptional regulator